MKLKIALLVFMFVLCGCAEHPILSPDALKAALDVSEPYIYGECKEVAIYPGYELNYGQGVVQNGFGGIVGGCGKYLKLTCWYVEDQVRCMGIEKLEKKP